MTVVNIIIYLYKHISGEVVYCRVELPYQIEFGVLSHLAASCLVKIRQEELDGTYRAHDRSFALTPSISRHTR